MMQLSELQPAIQQLSAITYLGNTLWEYTLAFGVFLAVFIGLGIFKSVIALRLKKLAEKSTTDFDDTLVAVVTNIGFFVYVIISVWFGIKMITVHHLIQQIIDIFFLIALTYQVMHIVVSLTEYVFTKYAERTKKEEGEADGEGLDEHMQSMVRILRTIIKVIVWIIGLLLILSNLNVNISSLVASLGIGGIAVALALQNVLSDLFSSFSIYLDKPFKVGDFINVAEQSGTVERIGMKSTRIKTLQGEQLVISNKELTSAQVRNFKKMERRRVVFTLSVAYETGAKKLEKIPSMVQKIIEETEGLEFSRCHFATYGPYSLDFEVVFFVESSSYVEYMDHKQEVNLAIYSAFEKEKIDFAYPTRTVYMKK